jgi:hypothetical protein
LVAITVNAYVVPLVSPVTAHGLAEQVADAPPGDAVTVYPVIAAPPLEAGAVHDTLTEWLPPTAMTPVGALGLVSSG